MTFIPAYKPGQQFDSRWREEPPERHECFELCDVCSGCLDPECDDACEEFHISPECEGGCGPRCACAFDQRED